MPTLVVTSESDLAMSGMYRAASILAEKGVGTLVTLKESVLDLSAPTTANHTSWGPLLAMGGCYGTPFYGIARHFGIIEDANGVASSTVASFLKPVLSGGTAMTATDKMVDDALNTKGAMNCCTPFPLVRRSPSSPGALAPTTADRAPWRVAVHLVLRELGARRARERGRGKGERVREGSGIGVG